MEVQKPQLVSYNSEKATRHSIKRTELYISYNYDTSKMKDINELDDDDLELSNYKLI